MDLNNLHRKCLFVTSFEEDGQKITVKCADTLAEWREVLPEQPTSAIKTEDDFAEFITNKYRLNRIAGLKSHLRLSGYTDIIVIWEPEHLFPGWIE